MSHTPEVSEKPASRARIEPPDLSEKGALKGTQTRDKTIPAADGKREITAHAAVHGLEIPTKDSVVEVKIRLEGASIGTKAGCAPLRQDSAEYARACLSDRAGHS